MLVCCLVQLVIITKRGIGNFQIELCKVVFVGFLFLFLICWFFVSVKYSIYIYTSSVLLKCNVQTDV